MEIHKYTDILGKTLEEAVYEGRMVYLTATGGAKMADSAAQAVLSRYLVAWPVDNKKPPIYQPYPSYSQALRGGWDKTDNTPFSATVYTTYPGLESTSREIPSGTGALLYEHGEFTVASGSWVYSTSVNPGDELEVTSDGTGKLTALSGGTAVAVCTAVASNGDLTFRTYGD